MNLRFIIRFTAQAQAQATQAWLKQAPEAIASLIASSSSWSWWNRDSETNEKYKTEICETCSWDQYGGQILWILIADFRKKNLA